MSINNDLNAPAAVIRARQDRLLAWFDSQKRDLPWRRQPSLYGTWIAEIMLQQTTVATVVHRWQAFLERFPDVRELARAAESEVLKAWSGLGYYRRARWLHQAARQVVSERGGRLPRDPGHWRTLPGVGEYTAAAIASIGLGLAVPVVDVNVHRVLLRWHCADQRLAMTISPSRMRDLAEAHLACERPSDWNQALMDLGARLCRAATTDCMDCPVRMWCAACLAGTPTYVSSGMQRSPTKPVQLSVLALCQGDCMLWLPSEKATVAQVAGLGRPQRLSLSGLLAGMWSLPTTPWYDADLKPDLARFLSAWRCWLQDLGWRRPRVIATGNHRHAITCHRLRVQTAAALWPGDLPRPEIADADWLPSDRLPPLASLTRQSLAVVAAAGWGFAPLNSEF